MKIKLNESIICGGKQYLPPNIVDIAVIGITEADADVLIRRGTAVLVVEQAPAETEEQRQAREAAEAEAAEPEAAAVPAAPVAKPAAAARKR